LQNAEIKGKPPTEKEGKLVSPRGENLGIEGENPNYSLVPLPWHRFCLYLIVPILPDPLLSRTFWSFSDTGVMTPLRDEGDYCRPEG